MSEPECERVTGLSLRTNIREAVLGSTGIGGQPPGGSFAVWLLYENHFYEMGVGIHNYLFGTAEHFKRHVTAIGW